MEEVKVQPKLPLEKSEYFTCIGIALSFGKDLKTAREDWQLVNNQLGTDYHRIHSSWQCCSYDD